MQNNIDITFNYLVKNLVDYARSKKMNPLDIIQTIYNKIDFYYFEHKAFRSEFDIKAGDLMKFDKTNIELIDGNIYYFSFQFSNEEHSYYFDDWGKYNQATGTIEADSREFELDEIKIKGQLIEVTSEL